MSDLAEISIEMHGPAAKHNMPCAVCRVRHAVLDLSTGIMQPCWLCQDVRYRVAKEKPVSMFWIGFAVGFVAALVVAVVLVKLAEASWRPPW